MGVCFGEAYVSYIQLCWTEQIWWVMMPLFLLIFLFVFVAVKAWDKMHRSSVYMFMMFQSPSRYYCFYQSMDMFALTVCLIPHCYFLSLVHYFTGEAHSSNYIFHVESMTGAYGSSVIFFFTCVLKLYFLCVWWQKLIIKLQHSQCVNL